MKASTHLKLQIGKNGITQGFLEALQKLFEIRENIKICVLKSGGHEREKVKQMETEILNFLGNRYTSRIVGFTIFIKKWRKPKRV
jgi:CRS1 / YhbY (CRM) domain.